MEFDQTQFNPNAEQGEILSFQELMKNETPSEEIIEPNLVETNEGDEVPPVATDLSIPAEQTQLPAPVQESYLTTLVNKKIESGEWAEVEGLEEMGEITEDLFNEILEAQITHLKKEATTNTVKTDTLSPMMVKALEIDKNGGNISQVFETYKNIYENPENPIASLNLEDPSHQESLLRYFHKNRGLEDFEVESIVQGHKKNLTLDKAAGKAKQDIDTVFNNYLDQQAKQAEEVKKQNQEALKSYRANIAEELKKYSINENYKKTLVDKASKPDEKGVYAVDALYDEWRRTPEKAAKLLMFLTNEDEYIKTRAEKVIISKENETFNKIKLAGRRSAGAAPESRSLDKESGVLSLSELQ